MIRAVLLAVIIVFSPAYSVAQEGAKKPPSAEGRLLYANDDDWDWATPLDAKQASGLAVYGKMPWSALDWLEEGLDDVRGVLIGQPPLLGNYLTMGDLNRIRGAGPKRSYEHLPHRGNLLRELMKDKKRPNVIILMQDTGPASPEITAEDVEAAWRFVKGGGRLLILDDWTCYRSLMTPFVDGERVAPRNVAPPDKNLEKEVAARVSLLGDADFKAREKAFHDLLKMGRPIHDILSKIKPDNLEAARRVQRILELIRPPAPDFAGGDWLAAVAKQATALYAHAEVKGITRDGPMLPGAALCIRMSPREDKERK
jgi:hypothetical protein